MLHVMTISQPAGSAQRAAGMAMLAAPVFVLLYGLIRLFGGRHGPSFGWSVGHLIFLVGIALFAPVVVELRRQVRRGSWLWKLLADLSALVAGLGLLAQFVQIVIDLMAGTRGGNSASMDAYFDRVQAIPGVEPAIYTVGPVLFYVGLLALAVLLAIQQPSRWTVAAAVLVGFGVMMPAISLDLIPVGAVLLLLGLAGPGVQLLRNYPSGTPRVAAL
jgi:hypothetical protein